MLLLFKLLVCLFIKDEVLANINESKTTPLTGNTLNSDKNPSNITDPGKQNNINFTKEETYFNVTASYNETTENLTDSTNLVATSSSTTSPMIHHTSKNTHLVDTKRNHLCDCDLTFGSCDVNCCCDIDCSIEDNLAFDQCVGTNVPSIPKPHYCVQTSWIYKNNAPYRVKSTSNNMFCIVQDNVEQQYKYRTHSEALSVDQLKSITTKDLFCWGVTKEDFRHWIPKEMKVGSELYVTDDDHQQFQVWRFPASLFSAECQAKKNVTYLLDQKSTCSLKMNMTSSPCSHRSLNASFHHGFYLLRNPAFLNDSTSAHENHTVILVTPTDNYTCLDNNDVPHVCPLRDGHLPSPAFDEISGVCHNVVTKVTYQILHNGTSGLINATAKFQLETIDARSQYVNQAFDTVYLWNKKVNSSFARSGNPGYIVGRPVLAGRKIINTTNEENDVIELNKDSTKWLTIVKAHHNGFCTDVPENRAPVKFGENLMSACIFKFAPEVIQSCDNLQKTILTIINGTSQPNSVGYFGNSNYHNVSEWIPIQFVNSPNSKQSDKYFCQSIITDLHIDIYHAATGTISGPQQKIIGIVFQYDNRQDIDLNCTDVSGLCRKEVMLTSSVNFKDASEPTIQLFGQPPSLHASVPVDFFYPFTFSSQTHSVLSAHLLLLQMLCLVTF